MKRPLPLVLTLLVAAGGAASLYTLGKRNRVAAPAQGPTEAALFSAAPSGSGVLFSLNAETTQPLRSLHYLLVQGSDEVLAQALTQTGDQLIGRFQGGAFTGTLRLAAPDGAPAAFFRFARLQDAARMQDGSLLLLFTDGTGGSASPWLVAADPASGEPRWALKGAGSHLTMARDGKSCLTWDGASLGRAVWNGTPGFKALPLPDGVSVVDAVVSEPDGAILLAHPGGIARFADKAWSAAPLPEPGALAFPGVPSTLALAGGTAFWQPRPGQLARISEDGSATTVDLSTWALPKGHAQDAALLRLAGADAKGRLWFTLMTPDLTVAAHPVDETQPSAALQAMAALNGSTPAAPAPSEKPVFDSAAWADYLKSGLDRAYVWDPSNATPRLLDWKTRWPGLGAPQDFPMPLPRHLHPEDGAVLEELGTRAWWAPLDKF